VSIHAHVHAHAHAHVHAHAIKESIQRLSAFDDGVVASFDRFDSLPDFHPKQV
jgi:hypothetical protein